MLDSDNFVSRKNFVLASVLDIVLRVLCSFVRICRLVPERKGNVNRILFIELGHLGDALLMTPAIRLTKQTRPELEIHCLASSSAAKALEGNPHVARIQIVDAPWYEKKKVGVAQKLAAFINIVRQMMTIAPETVVNFRSTGYHSEHLAMYLAGIPRRVGYSHKGLALLLTVQVPFRQGLNVAQQKAAVIGCLLKGTPLELGADGLRPDFNPITGSNPPFVINFLEGLREGAQKIGINISAQHAFLWPEDYFVRFCQLLYDSCKPEIVFLGTADFVAAAESIRANLTFPTHSLVGATTLADLSYLLSGLDLLVTVDTGMRHIANSVGTPVVVLRHGADVGTEFGKYVDTEDVLVAQLPCTPCGSPICPLSETPPCMHAISPEMVLEAVHKRLAVHHSQMYESV
jgi:ADP-heptose:LPS heptosyltransferase